MVTREESERTVEILQNGKFHLLKDTPHPIEKVEARASG